MRTLACLVAAGMLAVSAPSARAATEAYGEAFDTLYRIDLDNHTASSVGRAGSSGSQPIANISGLSTTADGTVYAVSGTLKALIRIDTGSGRSTIVAPLGLDDEGQGQFDSLDLGMTADCGSDALWLVSGALQKLWRVDPATGSVTLVGSTGHSISGLVAYGNALYGTGSLSDHTFYRINKSTGVATAIGSFGSAAPSALNSVSMSFGEDGTLYAVLNYVPPTTGSTVPDWSDLATIDLATGEMKLLGPIVGPSALQQVGIKGFTTLPHVCGAILAPVPTPALGPFGLFVLGASIVMLGGWRARRVLLRTNR